MSLASQILARRMRLPRAQTRRITFERDLRVPMDDGAVLLADRWLARTPHPPAQPTVLVRSPYGRRQIIGLLLGRLLAERGMQVVIQSVRGTFGSEGTFNPFDERADGLATLRWIRQQPWHSGPIGMIGPSYLGLVQWAVAAEAGDELGALSIQVSASQFHGQTYGAGSLSLETAASWMVMVANQERRLAPLAMLRGLRSLSSMFDQLPLDELDVLATGAEVAWFREAQDSQLREDPYWVARDYAAGVERVSAPVQLIGGWQDIFLPWLLADFTALQNAGRRPQLIIGPWTHTAPGLTAAGLRDGLGWLRAGLLGDDRLVRPAPVSVFVTGERSGGGWRDLPSWPPPGTGEQRLWLADQQQLVSSEPPENSSPDRYRYDPQDPTPSLGGPVLLARRPIVDNRPLEARPDVLSYTTPPLAATLEAIGPVRVELWVRASSPDFDLFARACDVQPDGASWNVCDALIRVAPGRADPDADPDPDADADADAVRRVALDLWPTAHRFAAGHRIRLQISSAAYPRYAHNPESVEIEVLHDAEHPSALILPAGG
jgi:putative CocE/NonD family hydrolase